MAATQSVSIALTSEQLTLLNSAVEAGEYATTSEIVTEAIREWQINRDNRSGAVKRLRQLWDDGKASGPSEPLDIESMIAGFEQRLKHADAG